MWTRSVIELTSLVFFFVGLNLYMVKLYLGKKKYLIHISLYKVSEFLNLTFL